MPPTETPQHPVIPEGLLRDRAIDLYEQVREKHRSDVIEWLAGQSGGKLAGQVQKWLNQAIITSLKGSCEHAVKTGGTKIGFAIALDKLATKMLASARPDVRQKIPVEMLKNALALIAEDHGYRIEGGRLVFELDLTFGDDEVEGMDGDDEGTGDDIDDPPALPAPPEE